MGIGRRRGCDVMDCTPGRADKPLASAPGQPAGASPPSSRVWIHHRYSWTNVAPAALTMGCTSARQSQPPSAHASRQRGRKAWPKRAWRSAAAAWMARRMRTRRLAGAWLASCPRGSSSPRQPSCLSQGPPMAVAGLDPIPLSIARDERVPSLIRHRRENSHFTYSCLTISSATGEEEACSSNPQSTRSASRPEMAHERRTDAEGNWHRIELAKRALASPWWRTMGW
jgi:hypothetical protein